ncbi:MAG: hypothetical protein KF901_05905 [Myxococcales bacterium]|nr:hypothetical protein [Myxococcales bacterium]
MRFIGLVLIVFAAAGVLALSMLLKGTPHESIVTHLLFAGLGVLLGLELGAGRRAKIARERAEARRQRRQSTAA